MKRTFQTIFALFCGFSFFISFSVCVPQIIRTTSTKITPVDPNKTRVQKDNVTIEIRAIDSENYNQFPDLRTTVAIPAGRSPTGETIYNPLEIILLGEQTTAFQLTITNQTEHVLKLVDDSGNYV